MAYSNNPNLPKARAIALRLHLAEQRPLSVVARQCGVHRTTLWRWKKKWQKLNKHISQACMNRPRRKTVFQPLYYTWMVATESAAPRSHPRAISDAVVQRVLAAREQLGRCAEVVWHHLVHVVGLRLSVSSVKRIFKRHHVYDRLPKTRRRTYHAPIPRPLATTPGALVQTDTVHLYHPLTGTKYYLYTVIDLYTRMSHARIHSVLRPGLAATTILEAQRQFGFPFTMVQTDHGPEFSSAFKNHLNASGIEHRHSRLQRPNDNAHIERFNRTIQEECTGTYIKTIESLDSVQARLTAYLDYYNNERVHLGLQLRTPAEMLRR